MSKYRIIQVNPSQFKLYRKVFSFFWKEIVVDDSKTIGDNFYADKQSAEYAMKQYIAEHQKFRKIYSYYNMLGHQVQRR